MAGTHSDHMPRDAPPSGNEELAPLEQFRAYLRVLADMQVGRQTGIEASDIVQEALLNAHRHRAQFRGESNAELAAWLRQILAFEITRAARYRGRIKRDYRKQRSIEGALDLSAARLEGWLAADQPTPSQNVQRQELLNRYAAALAALPETQRQAMIMRHCQGMTLGEICKELDKSTEAVAGLLKRGLRQVRQWIQEG